MRTILTVVLLGFCGCGDDDGPSGMDGSTGDAGDTTCMRVPTVDDPCTVGARCELAGSPCGSTWTCPDGTWDEQVTCPPPQQCPMTPPTDGEPCSLTNPVIGPITCRYEDGCPAAMIISATCNDVEWVLTMEPCPGT